MIISDVKKETISGITTVGGIINFEDSNRPSFNLFIQTLEQFQDDLWADSNAFLIASILVAWDAGEKRIHLPGTLCPVLLNNLEGVFMMMKSWYPNDFGNPPVVEAAEGFKAILPSRNATISLMSGGIDSLCLLRSNHLLYPKEHSAYIKTVLTIEMGKAPVQDLHSFTKLFEGRLTSVNAAAHDQEVGVIPVFTNIYSLNPNGYFYGQKSYSSQLSAVLSFFSKSYNQGFIASSYDAAYSTKPWGSNPQLDAYYTSSHFRMDNSGSEMTRLKKVGIVADWPVGYKNIRVCQNDNTGSSNCGTCEKCIRTKLMLEALGKLRGCTAFPENNIDLNILGYLETYNMLPSTDALHNQEKIYQYGLTIPLLKERGRHDLAGALEKILEKLA
jgi:hypothetical protein